MKRFYKLVSTQKEAGGFSILLDGKPIKTPARHVLLAPNEALANAIVKEWAAQGETIKPDTMPLMQILSTRIDRVSTEREGMTAALMKYLNTDLLCYRTDHPPEMGARQAEEWDQWLEWFEKAFEEKLETTTGLKALEQPEEAHGKVEAYIKAFEDDYFTVLQILTPLSGSLVLGLAFVDGVITPDEVYAAARVEELYKAGIYNEDKYGPDPAQDKKDQAIQADLAAAAEYLDLLNT